MARYASYGCSVISSPASTLIHSFPTNRHPCFQLPWTTFAHEPHTPMFLQRLFPGTLGFHLFLLLQWSPRSLLQCHLLFDASIGPHPTVWAELLTLPRVPVVLWTPPPPMKRRLYYSVILHTLPRLWAPKGQASSLPHSVVPVSSMLCSVTLRQSSG